MVQVTKIKKGLLINKTSGTQNDPTASEQKHTEHQKAAPEKNDSLTSQRPSQNEVFIERRSGENRRKNKNTRLKRFDPRNKNDRRKCSVISCSV